ncbi:MAG: cupin domain-containing protein [Maribacter sp.]|nr:cupin domain-containing protein [Maribacter sp.]
MKSLKTILITGLGIFVLYGAHAQSTNSGKSMESPNPQDAQEIIESYVSDYRNDRFAADAMHFGIEIPNYGSWTIEITGKEVQSKWEVLMKDGLPKKPTFIYRIEYETLKAIHEGKINALTAQGKAFSGDYTPMSIKQMEGYEPSMEEYAKINPFSFHFWTRGFPEIIPFSEGMTRKAHGSNFTVFYYETGLRTAWYSVLPEERVRDDAREQAAPFPMLIVAIKGTTEGEVDGQSVSLAKGNTIFIPAGVNHKWWNETNEATEAILIMFGKGA